MYLWISSCLLNPFLICKECLEQIRINLTLLSFIFWSPEHTTLLLLCQNSLAWGHILSFIGSQSFISFLHLSLITRYTCTCSTDFFNSTVQMYITFYLLTAITFFLREYRFSCRFILSIFYVYKLLHLCFTFKRGASWKNDEVRK